MHRASVRVTVTDRQLSRTASPGNACPVRGLCRDFAKSCLSDLPRHAYVGVRIVWGVIRRRNGEGARTVPLAMTARHGPVPIPPGRVQGRVASLPELQSCLFVSTASAAEAR
jgi:hypothetical protein